MKTKEELNALKTEVETVCCGMDWQPCVAKLTAKPCVDELIPNCVRLN